MQTYRFDKPKFTRQNTVWKKSLNWKRVIWHDNNVFKYFMNTNSQATSSLLLTHWGRMTHICVGNLTIISSDNSLSPDLTGPLGTKLSEILVEIQTFSLKKIRLKMSSAKWCPFRLGLNVLIFYNMRCKKCFTVMHIFIHAFTGKKALLIYTPYVDMIWDNILYILPRAW